MQQYVFTGALGRDPEMRYTSNGTPVTEFTVAVNQGRDQDGEERPPLWWSVTAWSKLAENCAEYLRKGRKVAVVGRIEEDEWKDDDGNKRTKRKVIASQVEFLSPREAGDDEPAREPRESRKPAAKRTEKEPVAAPAAKQDSLDDLLF